jgi:hypothetical protein
MDPETVVSITEVPTATEILQLRKMYETEAGCAARLQATMMNLYNTMGTLAQESTNAMQHMAFQHLQRECGLAIDECDDIRGRKPGARP